MCKWGNVFELLEILGKNIVNISIDKDSVWFLELKIN